MRKSVAVAADRNGLILGSSSIEHGISLHATPRDVLQSRLRRLIQDVAACAGRGLNDLADSTICIGLTGVTFPYDAEVDLPREFGELQLDIKALICTGDAEIVFASHARSNVGGAILCHMGSTAYTVRGCRREDRFRVGGWGPAFADQGSGYWIGRSALRSIGAAYEARKNLDSPLWKFVVDWLTHPDQAIPSWRFANKTWNRLINDYTLRKILDTRSAIFSLAHEVSRESVANWREVASSLVTPVVKAAEQGDSDAQTIISDAANHLVNHFVQALDMSKLVDQRIKLVLYGGVLTHHEYFRKILIKNLKSQCDDELEIITAHTEGTMRPACGALLFALGNSTTTDLQLPPPEIIKRLEMDPNIAKPNTDLEND